MVRVPPEYMKLIAYKETVQAFGSAQAEPGPTHRLRVHSISPAGPVASGWGIG